MTQNRVTVTHLYPADTNQVEDGPANSTVSMKSVDSGGPADSRLPLHNKLIQKDQNKKTQSYKVESVSRRTVMDVQNFSLENKRESEYVSQSRSPTGPLSPIKHRFSFLFCFFFGGRGRRAFTNYIQ